MVYHALYKNNINIINTQLYYSNLGLIFSSQFQNRPQPTLT